ncbi:MAG: RAMP superfamily CRISPR-associated protein [Oscillospiraceae bacterium]
MFEKLVSAACAEFDLCADGPVLVSGGASGKTDPTRPDNTFMTGFCGIDHKDEVYVIPGSTVKGVIRNHLGDSMNNESLKTLFGKIGSGNQKSKIKFNDAYAVPETISVSVRHSTAIDPLNQSAKRGSLNNMEIVEQGVFKAGFIIRNYTSREMEKILLALYDVNSGEVRFGGKKSRGFGKMKIGNFRMKVNSGYDEELNPINEMLFSSLEEAAEYFGKAE